MERTTLIEKYILGTLSESESANFEAQLRTDKELHQEYLTALHVMKGILKEGEQDDIELRHALKNISEAEAKRIAGPKILRPKMLTFRSWITSAAAIIVVALGCNFFIWRSGEYARQDALYATNCPQTISRSDGKSVNINFATASNDELKENLPLMEEIYAESAGNDQLTVSNGSALAMVYIKLHKTDKAKALIDELLEKYSGSDDVLAQQEMSRLRIIRDNI